MPNDIVKLFRTLSKKRANRTFIEKITYGYRRFTYKLINIYEDIIGIPSRLKMIIAFLPVIYRFRTWDYSYLLHVWHKALDIQLKSMDCGKHLKKPKPIHEGMKELNRALLDLAEGDHLRKAEKILKKDILHHKTTGPQVRKIAALGSQLTNEDLKIVSKNFKKYILEWWD